MSQAKPGDTVRIHYTSTLNDGTQFDSSVGRDPLEFAVGGGMVIPGFDSAVQGMTVGDSKSFTIEPEEAYGTKQDHLIQEVPRGALPEGLTPEVGMPLQSQSPDGQIMDLVITEVTYDTITVDANYPLADKALTFDIELVAIA